MPVVRINKTRNIPTFALPWIYKEDLAKLEIAKTTMSQDLLKNFVSSLSKISPYKHNSGNAHFCFMENRFNSWDEPNKTPFYWDNSYACHGAMAFMSEKSEGFLNVFQKNCELPLNRPFLEFIWSTRSPWAKAFEHVIVIRDKDNDDFPIAILLKDVTKTDRFVFGNACIAGRQIAMYRYDAAWNRLVEAGFNKPSAFILGNLLNSKLKKGNTNTKAYYENFFSEREFVWGGWGGGECPFAANHTRFSPKKFMEKNPEHDTEANCWAPGRVKPANHSNYIWHKPDQKTLISFATIATGSGWSRSYTHKDSYGLLAPLNNGEKISQKIIDEIETKLANDEELVL